MDRARYSARRAFSFPETTNITKGLDVKDFIGLEKYIDEDFARRTDHRYHAPGCPASPDKRSAMTDEQRLAAQMGGRQPWASQADLAWTMCLHRCGAIDAERAAILITALRREWDSEKGVSGEERILDAVGGDMDVASTVNYGRTLQEPMFRLRLRDHMIEIFDDFLEMLGLFHRLAEENLDTIMVGHTHMNHGQPITYAHFMVSAFDGIMRSLRQFEQAYEFTNVNSGGCGSCSGTTWPVDRELMAEYLGLDGVMEPTYDCEAAQDHTLAILFALSNMAVHLSRYAMTHYIWAIDELDLIRTEPGLCGISSFMPQKCDSGSLYEHVRITAGDIIGETTKAMVVLKGEVHGDVLPAMHGTEYGRTGMNKARRCIRLFCSMLKHTILQKERMLEIVKEGYSCATELAVYLIREKGFGGRLAHSVVATMVRMARQRAWKSTDCTGELLDEAAEYLGVKKPGLDTATVQECFDPEAFIRNHSNLGGTAPEENARLLAKRRVELDEARQRQRDRRARVMEGLQRLDREADELLNGVRT